VSRILQFLTLRRISSQIAVLIVTSLLLAQIITTATIFSLMPPPPFPPGAHLSRLAYTAKLIDAAPTADARAAILDTARGSFPELIVAGAPPPHRHDRPDDRLLRGLRAELGDRFAVFATGSPHQHGDGGVQVGIVLPDGGAIMAPLPPPPRGLRLTPPLLSALVFLAIAISLFSLWATRTLTAPLTRFADAAERFTVRGADVPLSEQGPTEIRRVAVALNEMRARVRRLVEDRTQMLAAVSHDLRTPITRLRLRAEEIEAAPLKAHTIRDLETMQSMVQTALAFLRDQAKSSRHVPTDLPSLIQTVCDGFSDMGGDVSFAGPPHLRIDCDPDQVGRALANLIDNGLKFGTAVTVRLRDDGGAVIDVEDNGPGIPFSEKLRAMEPFYRGDTSRGLDGKDSFGLGLSIARSIADSHGGTLELLDAVPHGLLARLTLKRQLAAVAPDRN
jgi:signal transduction histidine kinase